MLRGNFIYTLFTKRSTLSKRLIRHKNVMGHVFQYKESSPPPRNYILSGQNSNNLHIPGHGKRLTLILNINSLASLIREETAETKQGRRLDDAKKTLKLKQ